MLKVPKTFYSLHSVARMMKIPKPTIDSAFTDGIDSIQAIKPIAHLFHKFEEGDEVSFAILKKHFDRWRETGQVPKVSPGRPPKWKDVYKCLDCGKVFDHKAKKTGSEIICSFCKSKNVDRFYDNINIPVKKDLYDRFKRVVDNANAISAVHVTYRDMIYVALEEFVQRRPQFLGGDNSGSKQ